MSGPITAPAGQSDKRLAQLAVAMSWLLLLLVLAWLNWRDHQQNLEHQTSLARQAANAGAQTAALYFQDVTNRLLRVAEKEAAGFSRVQRYKNDQAALRQTAEALKYRFSELLGFVLTDDGGHILGEQPAGHGSAPRMRLIERQARATSPPLSISESAAGPRFEVVVPWFADNRSRGLLLATLGCDFLCGTLRAQAPQNHELNLIPARDRQHPAYHATIPIAGSDWLVADRLNQQVFNRALRDNLLLSGAFMALFVGVTLLAYGDLKRRTRSLVSGGERYRELFETAGMAELVIDRYSGRILHANQAATDFFQRTESQLLRQQTEELLGLEDDSLRLHAEVLRCGESTQIRSACSDSFGEHRELELCVSGLSHGKLLLMISDITEQIGSLKALQENEEKLSAILNASADAIVLTSEEGDIQIFNPAAEMMFGHLKEEVIGRHIRMLIPGSFSDGQGSDLSNWISQDLGSTRSAIREVAGERIDGEEIPLRVSLNRISLAGRMHFVAMIQDLTEIRRHERKLDFLERRDVLTGLLNRKEFERRLNALLSFAGQADTVHALCFMDVDQFKLVNDTCGHMAGDELLKQLSRLLTSQLRESETIGRIGGDEFGVLLTDCTVQRAEEICAALLRTIRNFLFTWQDKSFDVAVSIGITAFHPSQVSSSDVISEADVACHMAKRLGRDRLHVYHQGDSALIRHHGDMHLVSDINQAISEGRFHLFAQPIVPIFAARQSDTHYEILVRMVDESGRMVIPDQFIPAAERYILMPAIDRWVINELFHRQGATLRQWAKTHPTAQGFLFAINLSGTSLTDDGFINYIKRQFTANAIPHRAICFEITETAAVGNLERAKTFIEELKELGCSFALDDFGTGLSSYAYLKVLPVDYLKIDGSFVRNMARDPVDYAMVDSINQIGHILGLKTIAEWAEDAGTLTQLRALNVDYAQGYGVGDLLSIEEFPPNAPPLPEPLTEHTDDPSRSTH